MSVCGRDRGTEIPVAEGSRQIQIWVLLLLFNTTRARAHTPNMGPKAPKVTRHALRRSYYSLFLYPSGSRK